MLEKYRIKFPKKKANDLEQNEEFCFLVDSDAQERKITLVQKRV